MREEHDLMPYEPGNLPPGPWLVFAPHPDDESFGMGGSLLRAGQAGLAVDIVFVTDGSRGADASRTDPTLVPLRRQEAESACRRFGVRQSWFWGEPDRGLRRTEEIVARVAALVEETSPASVFLPSILELHPDHRVTTRIVWDGLQKSKHFSGEVFSYDITTQGPANLLIDITSVVSEKRGVMAVYDSQVKGDRYLELVESLDRARRYTMPPACRAAEGFYRYAFSSRLALEQASTSWVRSYLAATDTIDDPLVSIIVRTRDRRSLLREAIASVLAQDYPRIELVVVNDGDADVEDLVEGPGERLAGHRCVSTGGKQGRSAAANAGLECASGEFFMFLDDDDWLDTSHITGLVSALRTAPDLLVAYAGARAVGGDGRIVRVFNETFDRNRLYFDNFIPINSALVSRSVIDAGLRFDPLLDVLEDWDFWLQVLQRTRAFAHIDCITANYRVSAEHGAGVRGGYDHAKRRIHARWSKTWGLDEITDFMTRLAQAANRARP